MLNQPMSRTKKYILKVSSIARFDWPIAIIQLLALEQLLAGVVLQAIVSQNVASNFKLAKIN